MQKFFKIIFLLPLLFVASCGGFGNVNQRFEDQYGMQIESMRMAREAAKFNASQADIASNNMAVAKNNQDWRDDFAANRAVTPLSNTTPLDSAFYAYEDRSLIDRKKNNEVFMPRNGETYGVSRKPNGSLPDDMFVITYNTQQHPPFLKVGDDFDSIEIPSQDAYQVKTEPSNKPYLLVDAASIQKVVDKINSERSNQDIAHSEDLIKELKQLRRQKSMLNAEEVKLNEKKIEKKVKNNSKAEVIVYNAANTVSDKSRVGIFGSLK